MRIAFRKFDDFCLISKKFFNQIISASSGDLGAYDQLKIFQNNFFNFVKTKKIWKFDEILSKFPISNFRNFRRRNFKQTFL